jgi:hypothetical protein
MPTVFFANAHVANAKCVAQPVAVVAADVEEE